MSQAQYGQPWRGQSWDSWRAIVTRPTIATLRALVNDYTPGSGPVIGGTPVKHNMVQLAMRALDDHTPLLNDEEVKKAFASAGSAQRSSNSAVYSPELSTTTRQGNPEWPQPSRPSAPSSTGIEAVQVSEKFFSGGPIPSISDAMSKQPITSAQLHLTYLFEARRAIRRFLNTTYHQSWQLEESCQPYLPDRLYCGGRIVSSIDMLQNLLGKARDPMTVTPNDSSLRAPRKPSVLVADPQITSLQVRFYLGNPRHQYAFSEQGQTLPFRGKGPIWSNNSCALDCAIVASRLLNLGLTVADRGSQIRSKWESDLPRVERSFLGLSRIPWERFTDTIGIRAKSAFLRTFLDVYNRPTNPKPTKPGDFMPATGIWSLSTSSMMQLNFNVLARSLCSKCGKGGPESTKSSEIQHEVSLLHMNDRTKQEIGESPTMSQLLTQYFGKKTKDCRGCSSSGKRLTWKAIHGHLPPRLVVLPDGGYRDIADATSCRIEFQYAGLDGVWKTALYRWLGGIYQAANHFRLYWNDCEPNAENDTLIIYDGLQLGGSIVGGVTPVDPDRKIPPFWSNGTDILFYERIESNPAALKHAADALKREIDGFLLNPIPQADPAWPDGPQAGNLVNNPKGSDDQSPSEVLREGASSHQGVGHGYKVPVAPVAPMVAISKGEELGSQGIKRKRSDQNVGTNQTPKTEDTNDQSVPGGY